jgi:hypothetical protein
VTRAVCGQSKRVRSLRSSMPSEAPRAQAIAAGAAEALDRTVGAKRAEIAAKLARAVAVGGPAVVAKSRPRAVGRCGPAG